MRLMEESTRDGVLEVLLNFSEHEPELKIAMPALPKPVRGVKRVQLPSPVQ